MMIRKASTDELEERASVLLVEDDRLTRTVIRHDLKLCGFDVDIAENGDVALKKLDRLRRQSKRGYDLVLTDVFMPKVNGEALISAILDSDFRDVPVAVMSANCDDEAVNRLLSLGAADYLIKPVRTSMLAKLRTMCLGRRSASAPSHQQIFPDPVKPPASSNSAFQPTGTAAVTTDSPWDRNPSVTPTPPTSCPSSSPTPVAEDTVAICNSDVAKEQQDQAPTQQQVQQQWQLSQQSQRNSGASSPAASSPAVFALPDFSSSSHPMMNVAVMVPMDVRGMMPVPRCSTFLAASGILSPLETRKAALARFRAKKARSHFAPKVRYFERKKLAESRPRYKGQFIKVDQLPKSSETGGGTAALSAVA